MKNYEDKIYSLGETVTRQTQAMSQAVQKTLENNGGVGIMTGSYDQNLSILSVNNLLLQSHLKNIFCLHNFSIYKNPLSVLCLLLSVYRKLVPAGFITHFCIQKGHLPKSASVPTIFF